MQVTDFDLLKWEPGLFALCPKSADRIAGGVRATRSNNELRLCNTDHPIDILPGMVVQLYPEGEVELWEVVRRCGNTLVLGEQLSGKLDGLRADSSVPWVVLSFADSIRDTQEHSQHTKSTKRLFIFEVLTQLFSLYADRMSHAKGNLYKKLFTKELLREES